ncbi:hypothetical protein DC030_15330, partial [Enterococcus faecalis]
CLTRLPRVKQKRHRSTCPPRSCSGNARAVIAHILLPKDYVRLQLTGEYATDKAGAAGTQLFDVRQRDWSDEVVAALGINRAWLPETFEGTPSADFMATATAVG